MRPFSLLIKPAGPDCNMACRYCFYTGKTALFGQGRHRMSDDVLEKLIADYMKLGFTASGFAWQGGEPTLMGPDFYKKVVELQQKYGRPGQVVSNALQTNGLRLDKGWCKFLAEYKFLVGVSLDGPERFHNYYRRDKAGKDTFGRVMKTIENCRENNVEFNVLVLLNAENVTAPDELFDFFTDNNIRYLQFIPCVEKDPATGRIADFSVAPKQYADFLCRVFDRWCQLGPDKLSIRMFDSILSYYLNGRHSVCTFGAKCNEYVVVEHNGDVFCCDFFVERQWKLGNILDTAIDKLADCQKRQIFAEQKHRLCQKCFVCSYSDICRGGCLKDRVIVNGDYSKGSPNESYFCQSYRKFFEKSLPKLKQIAAEWAVGGSPGRITKQGKK